MMGRRFLIAAFAGGMSFATISVAIPLELSALSSKRILPFAESR